MSNHEQQSRFANPARLVKIIAGLGFCTGAAMMAVFWWAFLSDRTERHNLESLETRLNDIQLIIDQRIAQQRWEFYNLLEGDQQPEEKDDNPELFGLVDEYQRAVNVPDMADPFRRLQNRVADLENIRAGCLAWRANRQNVLARLPDARLEVEIALRNIDEAVEKAYGLQRLDRALLIRKFRKQGKGDAAGLAQSIISAAAATPDLSTVRRDIADLALLVERLRSEGQLEFLADLKDNRIRTVLWRLRRNTGKIETSPGQPVIGLTENLLEDFARALFGKGYRIEDDHQTIVAGNGGLYAVIVALITSNRELEKLRRELVTRFDAIQSAMQHTEGQVAAVLKAKAMEAETGLRRAWLMMLLVWLVTAALFVAIARRVGGTIKRQIKAIEDKNLELAAKTDELLRSRTELEESEERLRFLSSNLLTIQEDERRRISLELHDELGQAMAALKLQVRSVEKSFGSEFPPSLHTECENLRKSINQIIENVRRLSRDLSPVVLDDLGFEAAVEHLVENFSRLLAIKTKLNLPEISHLINQPGQRNIYRILQELLNNIGRHSKADRVSISVEKKPAEIVFTVSDNGQGFNLQETTGKSGIERGLGLTAIAERVRILGGNLDIQTGPGKGTAVVFTVPL